MNVLVVDTSSWISYFKGEKSDDLDLALQEARVYLSPIVLAELLSSNLTANERKKLTDFLSELPLCKNDFDHWKKVGELRNKLLRKGITISTPDAEVAQCALDLNGYLMSEDKIFTKIAPDVNLRVFPRI